MLRLNKQRMTSTHSWSKKKNPVIHFQNFIILIVFYRFNIDTGTLKLPLPLFILTKAFFSQQTFVVEFVVNYQMCDDCHRVEAKDFWKAVVQIRQKVCIWLIKKNALKVSCPFIEIHAFFKMFRYYIHTIR